MGRHGERVAPCDLELVVVDTFDHVELADSKLEASSETNAPLEREAALDGVPLRCVCLIIL